MFFELLTFFRCKITKKYANTQKYLHISQKSSTFALAFGNLAHRIPLCGIKVLDTSALKSNSRSLICTP